MVISVIIADDHPIVRSSVRMEVERVPQVKVVGEASNTDELMATLKDTPCDLVITDFSMPGGTVEDGLFLIDAIVHSKPRLPVLILTMLSNPGLIRAMQDRGARALISKADSIGELQNAVRAVTAGEEYLSPTMGRLLFNNNKSQGAGRLASLSDREVEVLRLFVSGMTISEIAVKRERSVKTISHQKMSAMNKLGLKNDPELYAYAHENGFLN
ncbi:response regulator transcription factor [Dyella sp. C11]|uniref:response regulator transcription factor n=1 Tax=Dyella sp. C11 TaxID=2126991 RepID=UPI000D6553E7|nr:response regulator transcription factor [Dyella sp. C11]